MSRWHNTRLSPSDWTDKEIETRLLEKRLPPEHTPTKRELEAGDEGEF